LNAPPPDSDSTPDQPTPWWLWPHVLSLEAPLVAVLWQRVLAQAHGVRLTPMLDAGLALACWLIYLADRTLDTFSAKPGSALDTRHAFYRRHRRVLLLGVMPAAASWLVWAAFYVIPEGILWQAAGLSMLVALYLASWAAQGSRVSRDVFLCAAGLGGILLISRMPLPAGYRFALSLILLVAMVLSFLRQIDIRLGQWLPKEYTAALLFALGCSTSTRFLAMPETILEPVLESLLLAALFACNLHGISTHEKNSKRSHAPLVLGALVFTLAVRWLVEGGLLENSLRGPSQAVLGALVLHAVVQRAGKGLSTDAYRVLADLALILPLPLAWL
jgi:hypothetical protein